MSSAEQSQSVHEKERSYGSIMMERVTGSKEGRVDHVLQVCVSPKTKITEHSPLVLITTYPSEKSLLY